MTLYDRFREYLEQQQSVALATVVAGPDGVGQKMLILRDGKTEGGLQPPELETKVVEEALRLLSDEQPETISYELTSGTYDVFIDTYPAPPQLVIVGASHAAAPLSQFGKMLGFRVVITEARAAFAQPERFPDADAVLKGWPQDVLPGVRFTDATYVVLLSHDPRFDQPTLEHVLPTATPYIGAIGSRKTQRERFERLRNQGFSPEQLARIHGPVGLNIGARTAEETALAIMGEIMAVRRGKPAGFLRDRK